MGLFDLIQVVQGLLLPKYQVLGGLALAYFELFKHVLGSDLLLLGVCFGFSRNTLELGLLMLSNPHLLSAVLGQLSFVSLFNVRPGVVEDVV